MADQLTLGATPIQDFKPLNAALFIGHHVIVQRRLADLDKLSDLFMGQPVTFQPQCLHPLLNAWMRMIKAFVVKRLFFFGGEINLKHSEKPSGTPCLNMADFLYIVIP